MEAGHVKMNPDASFLKYFTVHLKNKENWKSKIDFKNYFLQETEKMLKIITVSICLVIACSCSNSFYSLSYGSFI